MEKPINESAENDLKIFDLSFSSTTKKSPKIIKTRFEYKEESSNVFVCKKNFCILLTKFCKNNFWTQIKISSSNTKEKKSMKVKNALVIAFTITRRANFHVPALYR